MPQGENYRLPDTDPVVSRRGLLTGALGVAAAGVLTACAGEQTLQPTQTAIETEPTTDTPKAPAEVETPDTEPDFTLDERMLGNIDVAYPYLREKLTELGSQPQQILSSVFEAKLASENPENYRRNTESDHGLTQLSTNYAVVAQIIQANPQYFSGDFPGAYGVITGTFQDIIANTQPYTSEHKPDITKGYNPDLYAPLIAAVHEALQNAATLGSSYEIRDARVATINEYDGLMVELLNSDGTNVAYVSTNGHQPELVLSINPYEPYDYTKGEQTCQVALVPSFQPDEF